MGNLNPCGCDPSHGLPRKSSIGNFCCNKDYLRAWRLENKERVAAYGRARNLAKFGLTTEAYDQMCSEQDGTCAVCNNGEVVKRGGKLKRLAVDHCHTSGEVRGLLCQRCNMLVGLVEPDPGLLDQVMLYIRSTSVGAARPESDLEIMARLGKALGLALEGEGVRTLSELIRFARVGRSII